MLDARRQEAAPRSRPYVGQIHVGARHRVGDDVGDQNRCSAGAGIGVRDPRLLVGHSQALRGIAETKPYGRRAHRCPVPRARRRLAGLVPWCACEESKRGALRRATAPDDRVAREQSGHPSAEPLR